MKTQTHPNLRSLFISGRIWFDKTGGNSYHSVSIEANGKWLFDIGLTYGYGDMYLDTALKALKKFGLINEEVNHLFRLREVIDLYTTSKQTLKKELFQDSMKGKKVEDYFHILTKIEALKNGEY